MRLLYVSHSFPPAGRPLSNLGGMQRVATELYRALRRHPDVTLEALVLRSSWRWTHLRTGPFLFKVLLHTRRRARRGTLDAVLFSSMVTASLAVRLHRVLRPRGLPMAAIVHGRDVTLPVALYQRLVPRVFDALDAVLPVSRATGAACLERGLAPDKLHVLPNGVDLDRFPPLDRPATMRRVLCEAFASEGVSPLPEDALLLCSVGRQVERKGFAWFIDRVMTRLPDTVHYWLAGDGPEGENLDALIAKHGLEARVRRLGRISERELLILYRGADLFIMPNIPVPGDMEGFGVVMLEAGLCGLPTIAARLEGIQDVITEGANGHLVESGDADAFVQAVLSYHADRSLLETASERALRHTADRFGWPTVADRYVRTLQALRPAPEASR